MKLSNGKKMSFAELEKSLLLYAVTDRAWTKDVSLYEQVEQTLKGGTTFVQLREKDLPYEDFLQEGKEIQELCKKYQVPFVINDNVQLAKELDADGVHIGQDDMKICDARNLIGSNKILGVSVQTVEDAIFAEKEGADYLGVGAVFSTSTKLDAVDVSYQMLKEICAAVKIPVVAIGGINKNNILDLQNSGICGVAVVSAIFAEKDIFGATKELLELAKKVRGA